MAASTLAGLPKPPKNPTFGGNLADYNASGYGNLSGSLKAGAATPYDAGYGAGFGAPAGQASIKIGGGSNDYASQIQNDPAFMQLKNTLSAQGISDAAHLRGAIQQALIQFGAVPDLPSDVLQTTGLDTGLTAQLASQNPFSVLAQLAQKYQTDQQTTQNQLAARGILSSGETGYQLGKLGQANALGQYNATNSLLGSIGTLNDQYLAGRQAAAQQLAQGALTAENTAAQNNTGGTGGGGTTATYNPATGTWVDSAGNNYDVNGNPVTLPPQTQTPPGGSFSGVGSGGLTPGGSAPVTPYNPGSIVRPGGTNLGA